jgi:hypothetical protein
MLQATISQRCAINELVQNMRFFCLCVSEIKNIFPVLRTMSECCGEICSSVTTVAYAFEIESEIYVFWRACDTNLVHYSVRISLVLIALLSRCILAFCCTLHIVYNLN